MRSITLAMDKSLNACDPFPLDPSLQQPRSTDLRFLPPQSSYPAPAIPSNPAMDLQYILSPAVILDEQQHQHQVDIIPHQPGFQAQNQEILAQTAVQPTTQPVPSSSRSARVLQVPSITRRPCEHVHPNPDDAIISFDSKTRSFPKPPKPSTPATADPHAEEFLRDMLGAEKWEVFSSRLFERRLSGKGKGKGKSGDDDDAKSGVSAVEFLVKVEVVKEILRTYVPHPYNPLKSLTHVYPHAPSGQVTLTRSTVLLLSGWSNTQFSYWARRAEAVSVLAEHDPRLRAVGAALERRLRGKSLLISDDEDERDEGALVTGKGLDAIVDEVKKRTGKSQFLRGKHSSLDPYGTSVADSDPEHVPPPTQYAMPVFQAELYEHGTMRTLDLEVPPNPGPRSPPNNPSMHHKRRPIPSPLQAPSCEPRAMSLDSQTDSLVSPTAVSDRASSQADTPSPRTTRSSARKPAVTSDNNVHHFPVSDSRSEVENSLAGGKRKPGGPTDYSLQKRARTIIREGGS